MTSSRTSSIMAEKKKKWPIYCDFSHFTSIIWPCGRDNLKSFSHILFKFVMHVTNDQFSDKFNNGRKKKWPIYCDFSHFTSIIWPCGRDNFKSFSRILFKFVMHVTNDQFSDKFYNGRGKKMADLLRFFTFTSIIWPCGRDNLKSFSHILFKFVMHVTNDQFSGKFNNGQKKKKMTDLLRFFTFYVNNLTLWAR